MSLSYYIGWAYLSLYNCLLRSVYPCAILRGYIKALYYIRSINTLYMYVLVFGLCVSYGYMVVCLCIVMCICQISLWLHQGLHTRRVYKRGYYYKGVHTTWLYSRCMRKLWVYTRLVYIDSSIIGGVYYRWYIYSIGV